VTPGGELRVSEFFGGWTLRSIERVRLRLSDGSVRVTLQSVLDRADVKLGSVWRPEYDLSKLVLKPGDPGF
jgi:hypothetical protein